MSHDHQFVITNLLSRELHVHDFLHTDGVWGVGLSFYLPAQSPKRVELRNGMSTCRRPGSPGAAAAFVNFPRRISTRRNLSVLAPKSHNLSCPLDGFDPYDTRPSPPKFSPLLLTLMKEQQLMSTTFSKTLLTPFWAEGVY